MKVKKQNKTNTVWTVKNSLSGRVTPAFSQAATGSSIHASIRDSLDHSVVTRQLGNYYKPIIKYCLLTNPHRAKFHEKWSVMKTNLQLLIKSTVTYQVTSSTNFILNMF